MNIILIDTLGLRQFVIPIVPENLTITSNGDVKQTDTLNRKINVLGNSDLRNIQWSSFFPVDKDYNFVKRNSLRNGWVYVNFLEQMKTARLPIRTIITTEDERTVVFNRLTTISQFNYFVDNVEDVNYTLRLVEFIR